MRCILPNTKQLNELFDTDFVLKQLKGFSLFAYQQLMIYGYPVRMDKKKILAICEPCFDPNEFSSVDKLINSLLRLIGLKSWEFTIGEQVLSFRISKRHSLESILCDSAINAAILKRSSIIEKWNIVLFWIRLYFKGCFV